MDFAATRNVFSETAGVRGGPVVTGVVAVGFAVTSWVWALAASTLNTSTLNISPLPGVAVLFDGGRQGQVLVIVLSLVLAAVGRVVAGVCTDRYGAQVLLPVIGVAAAVPVALAAIVEPVLVWVMLVCAAGVAGAVFPAGAAAVAHVCPLERRGRALATCGVGVFLGAVVAAMTGPVVLSGGQNRLMLVTVPLVGFAVVASVLVRDGGSPAGGRPTTATAKDRARVMSTASLAWLYATTFGAVLAMAVFLPVYLRTEYQVGAGLAMVATAGCVVIAGLVRPVGGWVADRGASARTLVGCFAAAAGCAVVQAFAPPLPWCAITLGGAALCLGLASGTVLALVGILAPPERVGTVAGAVGAIGALAGLVPPALLAAVYVVDGSFGIAMTVLAALLVLAATRVRHLENAFAARSMTATVATATHALVTELDSVDYSHRIVSWCVDLPQVDAAGLLLTGQHGEWHLVACSAQRSAVAELLESQCEGPLRECLRTGTPMYDTELATTVARWQRFASLAEWAGYASVCALPMRLGGQTIGVLTLLGERAGGLPGGEVPVAQALADLAAIAVVHEHAGRDSSLLSTQRQALLRRRALVDRAVGVLAEGRGVDMDTAFALLRDRKRSLVDAAREVIDSSLPSPGDARGPDRGERKG
jgi:NNP family nitrate/nitrite transporter-like MFS transporter